MKYSHLKFLILALILFSCNKGKENILTNTTIKKTRTSNAVETIITRDANSTGNIDEFKTALLGRKYNNPYTVANIQTAWNSLSTNPNNIQATHQYIKFMPSTLEQYKKLLDANYPLSTIPLDYEIIEWGDILSNPLAFHNGIPEYYSLIPVNEPMPDVPSTIVERICLTKYEDIVTEKAYELVGESASYMYDRLETPDANYDNTANRGGPILDLDNEWHHNWGTEQPTEVTGGGTLPPTGNSLPHYETLPNDIKYTCDCALNPETNKPSGCVVVHETQYAQIGHPWQGVNDVMVEFFGPFFQYTNAQTSANGCFSCNKKIHYRISKKKTLPVVARVIFISGRKTIKGLRADNIISYAMPMGDDVGNVASGGSNLNNLHIQYAHFTSVASLATLYYTGCHANNSIYEISNYANQDGINIVPNNIHVLLQKHSGDAAAPMIRKLLLSGSPTSIITTGMFVSFLNLTPVVGTWGIHQVLTTFPPDIVFGYNWTNTTQYNCDQMRGDFYYHELGHSIHYSKTSTGFWNDLVWAEGANSLADPNHPYGTSMGQNHAPAIALAEMWAEHCGFAYAFRRYGPSLHSRNPTPTTQNSWYGAEEHLGQVPNFIPYGMLGDLYDDRQYNTLALSPPLNEIFGITDSVNGFTNKQFFDEIGSSSLDIYNFVDNLKYNQLPNTGAQNTLTRFNILTTSYGL